jgi:hypothetical protein
MKQKESLKMFNRKNSDCKFFWEVNTKINKDNRDKIFTHNAYILEDLEHRLIRMTREKWYLYQHEQRHISHVNADNGY